MREPLMKRIEAELLERNNTDWFKIHELTEKYKPSVLLESIKCSYKQRGVYTDD